MTTAFSKGLCIKKGIFSVIWKKYIEIHLCLIFCLLRFTFINITGSVRCLLESTVDHVPVNFSVKLTVSWRTKQKECMSWYYCDLSHFLVTDRIALKTTKWNFRSIVYRTEIMYLISLHRDLRISAVLFILIFALGLTVGLQGNKKDLNF